MGKREERLAVIRHIVRNTAVHTQAELLVLVKDAGFECTQATISRDIADLGLEKRGRAKCYALPEESEFERMVKSAASAGNMVVVKTLEGNAPSLASVIDAAEMTGILGTVAGDDTIMMVAVDAASAAAVAAYLDSHKRKESR